MMESSPANRILNQEHQSGVAHVGACCSAHVGDCVCTCVCVCVCECVRERSAPTPFVFFSLSSPPLSPSLASPSFHIGHEPESLLSRLWERRPLPALLCSPSLCAAAQSEAKSRDLSSNCRCCRIHRTDPVNKARL